MRIATWNINSVRLRLELVLAFLEEYAPDVLCLQETKCPDEFFPAAAFAERGYVHQHFQGMKSYNGVAILSRLPLETPLNHDRAGKQDCRHISATLTGHNIDVHCLYIPAGGDEPDTTINEKFAHKLGFVDELTAWWPQAMAAGGGAPGSRRMIAVGDFNIAPLEHDVWSHKQLLRVVSHTPIEVEKLDAMQRSIGWVDAVRHFVTADQKLYSWWSYRARDWDTADRGRRLDHIWVTPALKDTLKGTQTIRAMRGRDPKPSDHVPVMIDLEP
jgi:exodeoxyribonuclease III